MNRSTNSAPDCLSTSYLIGSAFIGISMITLNSCGTRLPAVTSLMLIKRRSCGCGGVAAPHDNPTGGPAPYPGPRKPRPSSALIDGDRSRLVAGGEGRIADGG